MFRKYLIWIFAVFLFCFKLSAQNGQIILPIKINNKSWKTNFTELLQINDKDTLLIQSVRVDSITSQAIFKNINSGKFSMRVVTSSNQIFYPDTIILKKDEKIVLNLLEVKEIEQLAEVSISVKKPIFENDKNKLIVNIENTALFTGNNALEILGKTPGLFVAANDNVLINGLSGVQYLINGRQTYMSNVDIVNYLKNIDASLIKKIEVINNPGSKYDAAGGAGIINIELRKGVKLGVNGSISFTHRQGVYSKDNIGSSLNYRIKKLNIFSNFSYNKRDSFEKFEIKRKIFSENIELKQNSKINYPVTSALFNIGADYDLSNKSSINLMLDFSATNQKTDGDNNTETTYLSNGETINNTLNNNKFNTKYNYMGLNTSYSYKKDTLGSNLLLSVNYAKYLQKGNQNINVNTYDSEDLNIDSYKRYGNLPYQVKIYGFNISNTYYFNKSSFIEIGVKLVKSLTDNESIYYIDKNNLINFESDKSNKFYYKENITSGFVEFGKEINKTNFNIGIRAENTNVSGSIKLPNILQIGYNRLDLFPYVYIDHKFYSENIISLSVSRRINRPEFYDLNPYPIYYDPYTYTIGNAELKPEFVNKLEFKYSYKKAPLLTVTYSNIKNAITMLSRQIDETNTTYQTKDNLANKKVLGLSTVLPVPIKKWMLSINYFSLSFTNFDGYFETLPLSIKRTTFVYYNNTQFTLPKKWIIEIGGFYNKGYMAGLFDIGEMGAVNFGVQKKVFSDKLNVKINCSDVFYSQVDKFSFKYSNVDAFAKRYTDTRAFTISLRYNFGTNFGNKKKANDFLNTEKNRVKESEH